jgi:multidrug efflux pump subunit AcrA (membrane-fusion protein)
LKRRGFVRRVLLPALWLVIGAIVAVSLVKLAFLSGTASAREENQLNPTGNVPSETVAVEIGDVKNTLTVTGTIDLDPAKSALAPAEGVFVHSYVDEGDVVDEGDPLFQIRSETMPEVTGEESSEESGEKKAPPAPRVTYTTVVAPVGGKVSPFAVAVGDPVGKGLAIASVQPRTFKAVGQITPLDRYRLIDRPKKARITIRGGPKPFTCRQLVIGDAAAVSSAPANPEEGMVDGGEGEAAATRVTCQVPGGVTVFDGLDMSMEIAAGSADGVLVVPVTGVRGLLGSGTVWVLGDDGLEAERQVRLGITDGKLVEVKSGLKAGDSILRYVPGYTSPEEDPMGGEVRYE